MGTAMIGYDRAAEYKTLTLVPPIFGQDFAYAGRIVDSDLSRANNKPVVCHCSLEVTTCEIRETFFRNLWCVRMLQGRASSSTT